jgi:hypothetical protein
MKQWGFGLISVGALIAAIALFLLPSTVRTEEIITLSSINSQIGSGRFTETYNMPRAQLREMIFNGGGMLFLAGILLLVGGMLDDRLSQSAQSGEGPGGSTAALADADEVTAEPKVAEFVYDGAGAEVEASKNKEIAAWVFGGLVVAGLLLFAMLSAYALLSPIEAITMRAK